MNTWRRQRTNAAVGIYPVFLRSARVVTLLPRHYLGDHPWAQCASQPRCQSNKRSEGLLVDPCDSVGVGDRLSPMSPLQVDSAHAHAAPEGEALRMFVGAIAKARSYFFRQHHRQSIWRCDRDGPGSTAAAADHQRYSESPASLLRSSLRRCIPASWKTSVRWPSNPMTSCPARRRS